MSFILDALKKLERQKQGEGSKEQEGQATMQGGRHWGEEQSRRLIGWGSVAVALVALIMAGAALYRSQQSPSPDTSSSDPSAGTHRPESPTPSARGPRNTEEESLSSEAKKVEWRPTTTVLAEHPSSQVTKPEPSSEVSEDTEDASPEASLPANPVRLVGRNAADRGVIDANDGEVGAPSSEIPEGLPELVLQGTSVVEGQPVAVVNYQRLFEGDFIEGARVVQISDSLVELEFKGKRFKISF